MVGTKGRLVRFETRDGRPVLSASREGKVQVWPVEPLPETLYDRSVADLEQDRPGEPRPPRLARRTLVRHWG